MAKKPSPTPIRFDPAIYYDYGISRRQRPKGLLLALCVVSAIAALLSLKHALPDAGAVTALIEAAESVTFNLREDASDMGASSSQAAPLPATATTLPATPVIAPATPPAPRDSGISSAYTAGSTGPPPKQRGAQSGNVVSDSEPATGDAAPAAPPQETPAAPAQTPDTNPDMPAAAVRHPAGSPHAA